MSTAIFDRYTYIEELKHGFSIEQAECLAKAAAVFMKEILPQLVTKDYFDGRLLDLERRLERTIVRYIVGGIGLLLTVQAIIFFAK